jgi:hypothetical protein
MIIRITERFRAEFLKSVYPCPTGRAYAENGATEGTKIMENILIGIAILAGWFFLQWYVLPKMGIDT